MVISVIASKDDKYQASKENLFYSTNDIKDKQRIFRQGYSDISYSYSYLKGDLHCSSSTKQSCVAALENLDSAQDKAK